MRWDARAAAAATGAVLILGLGMLAAEATCSSHSTNPPGAYAQATACWLEGNDYSGGSYSGRNATPLHIWTDEWHESTYSHTRAQVHQDRWREQQSSTSWRDTWMYVQRYGWIAPAEQWTEALVQFRQQHQEQGPSQWQNSYAQVRASSTGPGRYAHADVQAQQWRGQEQDCRENAHVYGQVNGTTTSTPIEEHDCAAEAPRAPDLP